MKKFLLVLIFFTAFGVPAGAQTINEKSTMQECLAYLNEVFSNTRYKNYTDYYGFGPLSINKKVTASNLERSYTYFPIDWATFSQLELGEATDEFIPVELSFTTKLAKVETLYSKKREYSETILTVELRNVAQSSNIVLDLPVEDRDEVSTLKMAMERLAQLTKEDSDREAVSAEAASFMKNVPQRYSSSRMDMSIGIAMGEWSCSFVTYGDEGYDDRYGQNTVVFKKLDKNGDETGEIAWIPTRWIKEIDLEGENIVFSGTVNYAKKESRMDDPKYLDFFKLPVFKQRPGTHPLDREEVLRHYRFETWRYGAALPSNGFKIGDKVYND